MSTPSHAQGGDAQNAWSFGMLVRDLLGSPLEVVAKQQALRAAEQAHIMVDEQQQQPKRPPMRGHESW